MQSTIFEATTKTPFRVTDPDSDIKKTKFTFEHEDCPDDLFSDSGDSFKVTGNGEKRVLQVTPEDGVESTLDCTIIMKATDGQWDTETRIKYERIKAMQSCAEYMAAGVTDDGLYSISFYDNYETPKTVYCAFTGQFNNIY